MEFNTETWNIKLELYLYNHTDLTNLLLIIQ